jgi:hypothetical protein
MAQDKEGNKAVADKVTSLVATAKKGIKTVPQVLSKKQ